MRPESSPPCWNGHHPIGHVGLHCPGTNRPRPEQPPKHRAATTWNYSVANYDPPSRAYNYAAGKHRAHVRPAASL
jgi:hypothetical protein